MTKPKPNTPPSVSTDPMGRRTSAVMMESSAIDCVLPDGPEGALAESIAGNALAKIEEQRFQVLSRKAGDIKAAQYTAAAIAALPILLAALVDGSTSAPSDRSAALAGEVAQLLAAHVKKYGINR